MAVKQTKRQEKTQEIRRNILDQAFRLFTENGVDTVTVDDICQACSITKGTFYHNYESKDHVVSIALNNRLDEYLLENFSLNPEASPADQLSSLLQSAMDFFRSTGKEMVRKATEALVRSCVDVDGVLEGRVFLRHLEQIVSRILAEKALYMDSNALELQLQIKALLCGVMVYYAIQDNLLDHLVDWNGIIDRQVRSLFR